MIEPRKPTEAELAVQAENDQRGLTLLKYRLGPILMFRLSVTEIMKI